eukprot:XP_017953407.1 PREDICTED: tyrosine-protein kinase Srms [Xenopus tropicalis]
MSKGSLLQFLKGNEGPWLTDANSMHIISQVAEGMAYLENKHVLHITLAARNVLVGEELLCKIADFGLARILKNDFYLIDEVTTVPVRWTAPEVLTRYRYTAKSDVWSFGIVMYEVFMLGRTPYLAMAAADLRDELSCSICRDIYTDPVSLPCGHNFCRGCIGKTWDTQEETFLENPSCPECRERFKRRPELATAWKLRGMVERFCSTETEPGETGISCTYCLLSPVPAAKSCLHCEASLCDTHLRGHCQSAEHVLTEPTASFMGR